MKARQNTSDLKAFGQEFLLIQNMKHVRNTNNCTLYLRKQLWEEKMLKSRKILKLVNEMYV